MHISFLRISALQTLLPLLQPTFGSSVVFNIALEGPFLSFEERGSNHWKDVSYLPREIELDAKLQ